MGYGKVIGVSDDVGDVAIFFDSPRWRKVALLSHRCQRVPRCTALNINATPTTPMIITAQVMVTPPTYVPTISATSAAERRCNGGGHEPT